MVSQRPPAERIPGGQPADFPRRQQGQVDPTRAHQPLETRSARRPPPPPPEPPSSGLTVPWWGFALVILAVAGLTCGLWGLVLMTRGTSLVDVGPSPAPSFYIITATPTLGPDPNDPTNAPLATDPVVPPTISFESSPTPPGGAPITIGSRVLVTGTEGQGVTVRQGPSISYTYIFIGQDGDVFIVQDGPREADGYVWWEISDPNDPNRSGWLVEDYIIVIEPSS
jgi:hypothetical protein